MAIKQVIVIRRDLKMRRGKEIAQGSHASMAFITKRMLKCLRHTDTPYAYMSEVEREWLRSSFRKITLQAADLCELLEIAAKAEECGLEVNLIADHGITEFHGVKTVTALAIGPDYDKKIDPITSHLKLY